MASDLSYVMITPYSLLKSRTGGIIGRLLSQANLELVGVRMYAPSDEFVDSYGKTVEQQPMESWVKNLLLQYINDYFRPHNTLGISNRTLVLLFRGQDAIRVLMDEVVGSITREAKGDTIRGTFGDFIGYETGSVKYFEPAVLSAADPVANRKQLALLAEYAIRDGGLVERAVKFPEDSSPETTVVILKPDLFARRSSRPGNIIDMFSKTGLYIVAAELVHMSVAQATEFYGPLRELFVDRLKEPLARQMERILGNELGLAIPWNTYMGMADILKALNAEHEFNQIVHYMTGVHPDERKDDEARQESGRATSLVLLYKGLDAVSKIRNRLGSTDPRQAAAGTVRSDYGQDLMKNGAHASDSVQSAERERRILGLLQPQKECTFQKVIEAYLAESPS